MSFTPRVIYKKKECLAGQVIRTNITDEGIFRVLYNDVSGNMFCSVSRQSNYKQVIINSARNRTVFDVSNTEVNNFDSPFYGGTYHMNEISGNYVSTNDYSGAEITGFYTLQYNNNEDAIAHAGPWHMFSEPQLQSYIKQGDSSGNIYDTRGYSDILLDRNLILNPTLGPGYAAFPWANQFLYFFAISEDPGINNNVLSTQYPGINEVGTGVPDLWHFMNQTTIGGENPGVLNNFFNDSNIVNPTTTGLYLTTGPYGGMGNNLVGNTFRASNYYFASASPKYVWLDASNNATPDASGNPMNQQPDYYKGNFLIWVDTSGNADTSGNVYLGRKNRTIDYFDFSYNVIDHFTNYADPSGTEDISNVFVDIDIDVSRNAINENFNYIYSKPYFVACSDASTNIVVGRAPFDVSFNTNSINDISFVNFTPNSLNIAKYCKIKVFQEPNNTNNVIPTPEDASSNWYVCYYNTNKKPVDPYDNFSGMIEIAFGGGSGGTFAYASGKNNYDDGTKIRNVGAGGGYGLYPSMAIDKDGHPRIAFFGRRGTEDAMYPNSSWAIHLITSNTPSPSSTANWTHTLVKDFGTNNIGDLSGAYIDNKNNQPISLKISPFDDSNHIVFQDPKGPNSEYYCVSYWTDSDNIIDITKVDSSLNYLGLHSYGKTIDMSRASVEVYWDLSQSLCLFSRDFRRYDTSENLLVGNTSPLLMAKPYTSPLGGRLNDLSYINKNSSGWNGPVNYRFNEINKLYIVIDAKLTNDSLGTFENPIRNTLFCLGSLTGEGGFVCGLDKYPVRTSTGYFDTSGAIFMGIKGQEAATQADGNDIYASAPFQYLRADISGTPPNAFVITSDNPWYSEPTGAFFIPNKGELYRYKFYYNKSNSYIEITIKSLDNPLDLGIHNSPGIPEIKYCRRNIFTNGGFNIKDGYISIGSDSHSSNNVWNGEIQRVSVYATDISNVPVFDLSRNGEILNECTSTPFSSFFDISNNAGLDIEPSGNIYRVVHTVNALNTGIGDISGSSQYKDVILNDIYYYQRVLNQTVSQQVSHPGQYITAFDRFEEKLVNSNYYDLWAIGYTTYGSSDNDILPVIFTSGDGGKSWIKNDSYNLGISGESLLDIKTYKDPSGGRWVFVCGENYLLQFTNDYDSLGQPGIVALGINWYTVDFTNLPYGRKDGTGVANTWGEFAPTQGRKLDINNICVTDISKSPFPSSSPMDSNDFHLWLGTKSYDYSLETEKGSEININFPSGTPWQYEIWWQILDSNNTVLLQTSGYGGSYASSSIGPAGAPYNRTLWFPEGSYTILMYDVYGDGWHGGYLTVRDTATNNVLGSGTLSSGAGPGSFTFTVPSNNFVDYYDYGAFTPSYKDILIRGNQADYFNNTLDYSYNIITNNLLKPENNAIMDSSGLLIPTDISTDKIKNESFNTFSFGGNYTTNKDGFNFGIVTTDSFCFTTKDGGEVWDIKLNTDRTSLSNTNYPRGTWGSYVEKNQINVGGNYIYDNSGMYIQTSTEPWNGIPGLTLAYNNSEYDLSFSPIDSTRLKSITWDPSLNSTEKFWNVKVPDNNGKPVIYRDGGGNTIKVYLDSVESTNPSNYYKYKQKFWTFDSLANNNSSFIPNNAIEPSLYLRDSELNNKWQRINLSVVDPSLNRYSPFYSQRWDSFSDYDCSYALVNLPFVPELNINDSNNYSGFYKLGKVPFQPFVTADQSPTNLYGVTIELKYKINEVLILEADEFKERLNFQQLGIFVHYEQKRNPSSASAQWEPVDNVPTQEYKKFIPLLAAGSKYIFRARLSNKYGYGWYSNQSIEIEIPSPQPQINKLKLEHTLFENKISWEPFIDSFNGVPDVQTVYSYDIEKKYLDASNNWTTDISFSNFYTDLSGTLQAPYWGTLAGQKWTGPYNPATQANDLTSVNYVQFIDTDLSLNSSYRYDITCYSLARDKQSSYYVSQEILNGMAQNPRFVYTPNDASLNLIWTLPADISTNTEVTWDISWQEIRDDGTATNYGEFSYTDPYNGVIGGGGELRSVSFPLSNNHIQPDATYNAQIQVDYQNNTVVTDYNPSSSQLQTIVYDPSSVFTYYNYLQPPTLNSATYVDDTITVNWEINKGGTFKDLTFYQDTNGSKVTIVKTATTIKSVNVVNIGSGYNTGDILTILNTDISRDSNLPNLEITLQNTDISSTNNNSLKLNSSLLSSITNGKVVPTTTFDTNIFDLSFSNITTNRTDVSYNIYPVEGNTFIDLEGTSYYPGSYNIRVRSAYGDAQNGVVLYSKFSNEITLSNFVPEHSPKNFQITSYNELDQITTDDVSYVNLTWSPPGIDKYNIDGYLIPKNYKLTRKSNQSTTLDFTVYPLTTDISYIDTNSPLASSPYIPRIYHYNLDAEYE